MDGIWIGYVFWAAVVSIGLFFLVCAPTRVPRGHVAVWASWIPRCGWRMRTHGAYARLRPLWSVVEWTWDGVLCTTIPTKSVIRSDQFTAVDPSSGYACDVCVDVEIVVTHPLKHAQRSATTDAPRAIRNAITAFVEANVVFTTQQARTGQVGTRRAEFIKQLSKHLSVVIPDESMRIERIHMDVIPDATTRKMLMKFTSVAADDPVAAGTA